MTEANPVAEQAPAAKGSDPSTGRGKLVLILLLVAALVTAVVLLPVDQWMQAAVDHVQGLGWWGPVLLVGIYIVACVLFLPGSVLTLGAGAAFGVVEGSLTVSAGATLGAAAAFLVGRHLARDQIARKVEGNKRFAAVDAAVGREGFKIVLLTRLSPVFPFNVLNYAYGLTSVSFKHYFLGSWLGMIPGTIMYVYLGHAAKEAVGGGEKSTAQQALLWVGLLATIGVTVFVTRIARKALEREVHSTQAEQEPSS